MANAYRTLVQAESGLIGYWALDTTNGLTDLSTGGNNGTAAGGVTIGGQAGPGSLTATDFDGTDDRVTTTLSPFTNGTTRTYEWWANRDATATTDVMLGATGSNKFAIYHPSGSSNIRLLLGGADVATWTLGASTGIWRHYMLIFDESADSATLYANGASQGAVAVATAYPASPGNFEVGCYETSSAPFDGKQCHVAVYSSDKSSRAQAHYAAGISADPAGSGASSTQPTYSGRILALSPALYWRLNETSGTALADSSGNGRGGVTQAVVPTAGLLASDPTDGALSITGGHYTEASSYNPFSNAAARTYCGWASSDGTSGFPTLLGSANGSGSAPALHLAGTNVLFYISSGAGTVASNYHSWANAWPGGTVFWALIFDPVADTAELFTNGVSQGVATGLSSAFDAGQPVRHGQSAGSPAYIWSGVLDEFAIFEAALSASTIASLYVAGAVATISVQPTAPVPKPALALSVNLTDGRTLRFGPDEYDVDQVPVDASFDTELPGGYGPADITVPRPNNFDPLDVNLFASTRLYDARTNRTLHLGRIVGTPQSGASDVEFQIEGWSKHLEDDHTARMIFYDRDLSHWGGMSTQRKINAIGGGNAPIEPNIAPDATTGVPCVEMPVDGPAVTNGLPDVEAFYNAQGLPIAAVDYAWKKSSSLDNTDANWDWRVALSSDDIFTSFDITASLRAAGPGSGTLTSTGSKLFAVLSLTYGAAGLTADIQYALYFTLAAVIGSHNLTLQGSVAAPNTGRGLLVSDMVAYAIGKWAPLVTYSTGSQGSIEPTTFVVPHMVFLEDTTAREMIDSMVLLGGNTNLPMDWGVYDGADGKPEFFLKTPGNYGKTWRARRDQAVESVDAGAEASERLNGVKVSYDDGSGTKKTVGPVGSGANTETANLQDTDPTNPANTDGARHWQLYDAGITTAAGATLIGQLILAYSNLLLWRGTVNLKGTVLDDSGNTYPVARVRAGDQIIVEDDADVRPRRVINTSYDGSTDSVQASVGAAPNRLDVLLSKLNISLIGQL